MTTLNLSLSTTLQTTLGNAGVWSYAVYFDDNGANWTDLVLNGVVQNADTSSITLPEPYSGGKVYFLVQSQVAGDTPTYLLNDSADPSKSLITQESDINWANADTWDVRYDSIEVTLDNKPTDAGNLTSVNGFGLPMELSVTYTDGTTSTRGYNESANDLFDAFSTIGDSDGVDTYSVGPLAGSDRMAFSPAEAVAQSLANPPFQASDWDDYIGTLKVADPGVALSGFFNGAPDHNNVWHNGGYYSYSLEWDSTNNVFWLSPAANSQIQGYIKIKPDELANSIYSTLGDVTVYTNKDDHEPYRIFKNTAFESGDFSMNSGENNQWGKVLSEFLTGFTAGYYGTTGMSFNPLADETPNLNENWNWDPDYAFGQNLDGTLPADHFQDPYSQVFYPVSNSYGSGYTDNLMSQYDEGGPLLSLSNPTVSSTGEWNVDTIDLTIFDDSETPTGYEPTVIHHYLAPGGSGYEVPDALNAASNFKLTIANVGMVLAEDTAISMDVFGGLDGSGAPIWHNVVFDAGSSSPWQTWTMAYNAANANPWSVALNAGTDQGTGNLLISGFPTSGSDGIYWNRIHIGDKIFNLYAELTNGGTEFSNPEYAGQEGDLAIDGLASIQPPNLGSPAPETIETFTVTMLTSNGVTVNPDQLVFDPSAVADINKLTPNAPVAGTLKHDEFKVLKGQTEQDTNSIKVSDAKIAFGWTGYNPVSDGAGTPWIEGYTNKVGAQNYAEVTVKLDGHGHQLKSPITAQADIDGQWLTDAVKLSNGTYTVTMQEHLASASGPSTTTVNNESGVLTMKVHIKRLDIDVAPGDHGVELKADGNGGPTGNWLSISAIDTTAAPGTTLLLYATNEAGELISRDGMQVGGGVTLDDATLGTVGVLQGNDGKVFLFGTQAVYLEEGQYLNFASLSGKDEIEQGLAINSIDQEVVFEVPVAVEAWLDATRDGPPALSGVSNILDRPAAFLAQNGGPDFNQSDGQPAALTQPDQVLEKYRLSGNHDEDLTLEVGDFTIKVEANNDLSVDAMHGDAQRAMNDALFYLEHGATLDIEIAGDSDNINELAFVQVDINPETGGFSVDGVAHGDTDAFRTAVTDNLDDGFTFTGGGEFRESMTWTVDGEDGFYAPVLIAENGDVFVFGDANPGGEDQVRLFGHNTFGFEEVTQANGADFDYNDLVVTVSLPTGDLGSDWLI